MSDEKINRILELHDKGFQVRGISRTMEREGQYVSKPTVKKILNLHGLED